MSSDQLKVLKTPASIGSPGEYVGAVEFCVSGGRVSGSLKNMPLDGPSYWTTAKLLEEWKFSPGRVIREKKTASYERLRRVTWFWCVTRRLSNCYIGRVFEKWALTTADGRSFFRSMEHCAPWYRRSCCPIKGGVRRIVFWGEVVINNEAFMQKLLI